MHLMSSNGHMKPDQANIDFSTKKSQMCFFFSQINELFSLGFLLSSMFFIHVTAAPLIVLALLFKMTKKM